jgi:alpha-tubulin suppressor-like RCC1 family protein
MEVLLIGAGAEVCFIGNTNLVVAQSICTAISAVVDNDLINLKADGSITAWGASNNGGLGAPAGNDYTKIYSTVNAFAALKADGSITTWGASNHGGLGEPIVVDNDLINIFLAT